MMIFHGYVSHNQRVYYIYDMDYGYKKNDLRWFYAVLYCSIWNYIWIYMDLLKVLDGLNQGLIGITSTGRVRGIGLLSNNGE